MGEEGLVRIAGDEVAEGFSFGSKGLRLRQMSKMGARVPDGLLLSSEYLFDRIAEYSLQDAIEKILAAERQGAAGLEKQALDAFQSSGAFEKLSSELAGRLANIDGYRTENLYAVRSAAMGEDDVDASHAGQFETILNVKQADIGREIFACMASWWNDRATAYRKSKGLHSGTPRMSVIVQRMVSAKFAGVLFTRHPFDGTKDVMLVEAVSGLGEKLVSGTVTPSLYEIDRNSGAVVSKTGLDAKHGGRLSESHIAQIFSVAKEIEEEFGQGQDVEWAIEDDRLFVLQCRPITTRAETTHAENAENAEKDRRRSDVDIDRAYSRAVVEDLWADRMSDATSSIVFDEFSDLYTFKRTFRRMGLNDLAALDSIRVIDGYGYMSCRAAAMLLEYIPESARLREIEKMFPPSIRPQALKTPFKFKKFLAAVLRAPRLFEDPAQLPFLTEILLRKYLKRMETSLNEVSLEAYPRMEPEELGTELERLLRFQCELQVKNQWGYGKATLYTWLLRHLAVKIGGKDDGWVLGRISRIPDNVALRCQRDLEDIASLCDEKTGSVVLSKKDGKEVLPELYSEFPDHPATRALKKFLADYRYRSANRDFIHPRWDEIPETVVEMVARRLEAAGKETGRKDRDSAQSRQRAQRKEKAGLADLLLNPLVRSARKFLALREDLRFALDKVLHRIRRVLLEVSGRSALTAYSRVPDAVFFLTLGELREILAGESVPGKFLENVEKRCKAYLDSKDVAPAYYVDLDPESGQSFPITATDSSNILKGVAASPGVAVGVARLIRTPEEFHLFRDGDILVANNTDPGWTPLFVSASAVVVEMGGILNHCSIVAREYGIPAVVGIDGAMSKIGTGMRLEVDGNAGVVKIPERS